MVDLLCNRKWAWLLARASAKKFPGGGANEKKGRKIAPLSLFQGGQRKKDLKIAKDRKMVLLSLYLQNLYHVWKSMTVAPLPTPMIASTSLVHFSTLFL